MLEISGLKKQYPDGHQALRGIDLTIEKKGLFGILGPNGAGKTTLLSILVLALEPSAGRLHFGKLNPSRPADRQEIRGKIGYLPQDFSPIGRLTGFEYLEHCAVLRRPGLSRRQVHYRIHELLEAVSLSRDARRCTSEYSGGMRRRLGFAQALIHSPQLLVVDEPTSGLDPDERVHFRNLIAEVAENMAVLLSTHIVEDVEATCSRVGIISDGHLLFDGEPGEIMRWAHERLWAMPTDQVTPPGLRIVTRRIDDEGRVSAVVYSDQRVPGAQPVQATLEMAYSAFLALNNHINQKKLPRS